MKSHELNAADTRRRLHDTKPTKRTKPTKIDLLVSFVSFVCLRAIPPSARAAISDQIRRQGGQEMVFLPKENTPDLLALL
jgi:hypothetical protein